MGLDARDQTREGLRVLRRYVPTHAFWRNLQDESSGVTDHGLMRTDDTPLITLLPRLVVPDPDAAAEFYRVALGAEVRARFTMPDGTVTNIDLEIGGTSLSLTAEVEDWGLLAPSTVGGSPVLLKLTVVDARHTRDQMVQAGAEEVVSVQDRPYGRCEGRVRDPFGHLWIVSHITETLTEDEIRRRLEDAYGDA